MAIYAFNFGITSAKLNANYRPIAFKYFSCRNFRNFAFSSVNNAVKTVSKAEFCATAARIYAFGKQFTR
jgi:hypothetical protein